jgi:hypothetical protein
MPAPDEEHGPIGFRPRHKPLSPPAS